MKRHYDATSLSKFCIPCAKEANKKVRGMFKDADVEAVKEKKEEKTTDTVSFDDWGAEC